MEGDAFLALMRLTQNDDKVVANLAHMSLGLAKVVRDAEARALAAEAALEAERAKTATFEAAIRRGAMEALMTAPLRGSNTSVKITRQTSVVLEVQ